MRKLIALIALALCACASTALTFNDQLGVGYTMVSTIAQSVDALLADGKITPAQAQNLENQDDTLKLALDVARSTYNTSTQTAGNQLATALSALNALDSAVVALSAYPAPSAPAATQGAK